jgi:hypothetical protein
VTDALGEEPFSSGKKLAGGKSKALPPKPSVQAVECCTDSLLLLAYGEVQYLAILICNRADSQEALNCAACQISMKVDRVTVEYPDVLDDFLRRQRSS